MFDWRIAPIYTLIFTKKREVAVCKNSGCRSCQQNHGVLSLGEVIKRVMGRVLAIDYGTKRVGLAVTDPLKLIATPLATVSTAEALGFLRTYVKQAEVEALVVGMPKYLNNMASPMTAVVTKFIQTLQNVFPNQRVIPQDERYTSKLAFASMIEGGFKKKDRRNKAHLDKLSATIILQSFLAKHSTNGNV